MRRFVFPSLSVVGLLLLAQTCQAANPAIGVWKLTQPGIGESRLVITQNGGKLQAQEVGLGNVTAKTVTCQDGLLVVHWEGSTEWRGYWELNLNKERNHGSGKTVFTRYPPSNPPAGVRVEVEGRKVIVVRGVTLERIK